jgi:aspartyl-tRNA(Asn)/glutamyl-tRNA(Gln) amidotransferase subunit A
MQNLSLKELSEGLKQKKFSSEELTKFFLNRLDLHNSSINAFITIDKDKSLAMAKRADEIIKEGNQDYLTGIPIAQKDIFCAEGWKTSCGSKMLDNFIAPYDSTVISKFNAAGAVNLGKTNMDEFAMGSSNETSFYGNVKNPWDIKTVPGGSSGGSAAAVAGMLAPAATATDTGGSIRQPASLCGLTGLKPTYGLVSRYGMIAFASSLDQAGPMCHTAEDCAAMMNVMSGHDPKDSTSIQREKENYLTGINNPIKGLKIGVPKEFFSEGLDPEVEKIIEQGISEYKKLGAEIVEISLPK